MVVKGDVRIHVKGDVHPIVPAHAVRHVKAAAKMHVRGVVKEAVMGAVKEVASGGAPVVFPAVLLHAALIAPGGVMDPASEAAQQRAGLPAAVHVIPLVAEIAAEVVWGVFTVHVHPHAW